MLPESFGRGRLNGLHFSVATGFSGTLKLSNLSPPQQNPRGRNHGVKFSHQRAFAYASPSQVHRKYSGSLMNRSFRNKIHLAKKLKWFNSQGTPRPFSEAAESAGLRGQPLPRPRTSELDRAVTSRMCLLFVRFLTSHCV